MPDVVHFVPVDDWVEHEGGMDCVCGPLLSRGFDEDERVVWEVRHFALDGREHWCPDHDREACPVCCEDDTDSV